MAVGNTFGATALSSYGGFWLSYAILLNPQWDLLAAYSTTEAGADPLRVNSALGFYLTGWFIFTTLMLLLTLRSTVMFFSLFFTLDLAFLFLAVAAFTADNGNASTATNLNKAGGVFGLLAAFLAWYNAFAGIADSGYVMLALTLALSGLPFPPSLFLSFSVSAMSCPLFFFFFFSFSSRLSSLFPPLSLSLRFLVCCVGLSPIRLQFLTSPLVSNKWASNAPHMSPISASFSSHSAALSRWGMPQLPLLLERHNLFFSSLCLCWSNICPQNDDACSRLFFIIPHPPRHTRTLATSLIGLSPLTNAFFFLRSNSFFVVPVFHFPWSEKGYESRKAKPAGLSD